MLFMEPALLDWGTLSSLITTISLLPSSFCHFLLQPLAFPDRLIFFSQGVTLPLSCSFMNASVWPKNVIQKYQAVLFCLFQNKIITGVE